MSGRCAGAALAALVALGAGEARAQSSEPVCVGCWIVGGGALSAIASIPLFAFGERASSRGDGVSHGLATWDCAQAPGACAALGAADSDATPFFVAGGIAAGVGLALITTGAILSLSEPTRPAVGLRVGPTGLELALAF